MSPPAILPARSLSFPPLLPSCDASHSSSFTLASKPSLYVTFKVLQLVRTFRKRVQTRVPKPKSKPSKKIVDLDELCQDLDLEAYEQVDKYLGRRKGSYPHGKRQSASVVLLDEPAEQNESLFDQLSQLHQAVQSETLSLTKVASDDSLFVKRKGDFTISSERLSKEYLIELLVLVKDISESLKRAAPSSRGARTFVEGNEFLDLALDETYIANLQHLLLCLNDQLLRLLVSKLVEVVREHVIEYQRDQSKHCESWFFEFPDARHPLSTTWPWTIKPSLAVLWGVCWMFYGDFNLTSEPIFDDEGNMVDAQGQILVSNQALRHFFLEQQQREQSALYRAANQQQQFHPNIPRMASAHDQRLPRTVPHSPADLTTQPHRPQSLGGLNSATSTQSFPPHSRESRRAVDARFAAATTPLLTHQAVATSAAPLASVVAGTNNTTYAAAPTAYDEAAPPAAVGQTLLPEDFSTGYSYLANAYPAGQDPNSWQYPIQDPVHDTQQARFNPATPLPPRTRNPLTPDIRVTTTDLSSQPGYQHHPQDYYSATPVSSGSSAHLPDSYYLNQPFGPHLSPEQPRFMQQQDPQDMETPPRSPHSPRVVPNGQSMSRKRSHSEMSSEAPVRPLSAGTGHRSGSVASEGRAHSGEEDYSPRHIPVKRPYPPTNEAGKFYCNFSVDCAGQTFERKCEWSKHMDKHDRPYRCQHASCAKLQGFTYSGGLLRHEREVHGKHGGPKEQLMCPYGECKRHSGKGFTRKENLNEHIRRVHQTKEMQTPSQPTKRDATSAGFEEADTPASENADAEDVTSPAFKKRRVNHEASERSASEGVEDLKKKMQRLQDENEMLKDNAREMQRQFQQMQDAMRVLQERDNDAKR